MYVILIILGSIALMIGSMAAGILSCWLLWSGLKRVGHPEWGPPIILIPRGPRFDRSVPSKRVSRLGFDIRWIGSRSVLRRGIGLARSSRPSRS